MTVPLGYPEKFGALLDARNNQLNPIETRKPREAGEVLGPNFADQLADFVKDIDKTEKTGRTQAEEFAVGHTNDIHGTMIAVEQAEISLRLLSNVRNRVVDLYREVMRMGS
jgi:flagellar hook-basal body complex protein FliE